MQLDRILELTQDLSGLAFSSFLFIHLASPIGAAIVGRAGNSESVASSVQLAGRVVYRDGRLREALLVWIPWALTSSSVSSVGSLVSIVNGEFGPNLSFVHSLQKASHQPVDVLGRLIDSQPPNGSRAICRPPHTLLPDTSPSLSARSHLLSSSQR
ncbi:hypothetical protein H4Q26_014996 [Puccinia striiformis f. sp. tritici PST-130]|nr:hypothetical protein H4Q26_014996 [Puccinia striiformis f. sp. tritici PST-130]